MNRSIRLRIALAVFTAVVSLVALQIVYVLERFRHSFIEEVDDRLEESLGDLRVVMGTNHLEDWIAQVAGEHRREDEFFIEIRDRQNQLVARSPNVPDSGFPGARGVAQSAPIYWDFAHPRSPNGPLEVRGLETWVGDYHVCIGMSLKEVQRWYSGLRRNLVTSLIAIAVVGGLSAYWVAARSLRPVAQIAAQARTLGGSADGTLLPRTGSGDEIDRLAAVLNDLLSRIRAEVMRVRRITADAAHALRTPLTAIRGHLELEAARSESGASEHVDVAIEQVDDLVRFVNRLLLLEKLESGPGESLVRERIGLLAQTQTLVEHVRVIAEERGVSLECSGESVAVDADVTQIRQAILNLLDNALRHTPAGGKVSVEVRERGGAAELSVADGGLGLPSDQLERVFERFYSTRAGTGAGTGLGLPIARAIARSHGGDVTATSPGGGRFVLRLPLSGEAAAGAGV
ncbi:MAG TPA: HAMP domain-containing sensor histidine kinase [Myxococcota bacterium]|nr:HAMP domain-containing sensor histidine kinase [Myxococcota bacterium]